MTNTEPTRSTGKGEATRTRILDVALDLFRRQGFERTTMRAIATEVGLSLGAAYYYFESKEALVMAFYERASLEIWPRIDSVLQPGMDLEQRLTAIIEAKLEYFLPNRAFLGALFRHAADPQNALSPFSAETRHIRERDQHYF